jgi:hypothetical protein
VAKLNEQGSEVWQISVKMRNVFGVLSADLFDQ